MFVNSNGTIKSKHTYVYSTSVKDQLLRIESSDAIGTITSTQYINYNANDPFRPSTYKDNTLSWEGRRLTGYGDITYQYNTEGIRISKTVNNQTTSFVLEGSRIIKEIKPNYVVYYHYDNKGMLTGFNYNWDEYFYIRSLTGNIEKVIDSNGNISVEYEYDAWGNVLSITGDSIKDVNSFLYKGYYYDVETGLFYYNSDYFNPECGRWLNSDDVSYLYPISVNGLNLYAYCGNNPVMYNVSKVHVEVPIIHMKSDTTMICFYNSYNLFFANQSWKNAPPLPKSGFVPHKNQGNTRRNIPGQKGYGYIKKGWQTESGTWWYPDDHHTGPHYEEHDSKGDSTGVQIDPETGKRMERKGQHIIITVLCLYQLLLVQLSTLPHRLYTEVLITRFVEAE